MSSPRLDIPDGCEVNALTALYEGQPDQSTVSEQWTVRSRSRMVDVVADVYVRPGIWSTDDAVYIGFYDHRRQLVIASRHGDADWSYVGLPTWLGWDSHNYVSIALDRAKRIHVAANMHATPLDYFQSATPEIGTLSRVATMVAREQERRVTYPRFVTTRDQELTFWFRDGHSGNGVQRAYAYSEDTVAWRPLLETPFIDGGGRQSAYLDGDAPRLGPDGRYHALWVWRGSPEAESTHTLCYARSDDLVDWRSAGGRALTLPLTLGDDAIVDPVPPGRGLINNNVRLGFDAANRPLIVAHLRDEGGFQQIMLWTHRAGRWSRHALTNWSAVWDFEGRGSLPFEIEIGDIVLLEGCLSIDIRYGSRVLRLKVDDQYSVTSIEPACLPWNGISGTVPNSAVGTFVVEDLSRHGLRKQVLWQAVGPRRDLVIEGETIEPSSIVVIELSESAL